MQKMTLFQPPKARILQANRMSLEVSIEIFQLKISIKCIEIMLLPDTEGVRDCYMSAALSFLQISDPSFSFMITWT